MKLLLFCDEIDSYLLYLKLNFKLNHCFAWALISMLTSLSVVNVHAGPRFTPFHSVKKVRERQIKQINDY